MATQASRLTKIEQALSSMGLDTTGEKELDINTLTKLYNENITHVDAHLTRRVKVGGVFSKTVENQAIGHYPRVDILELQRSAVNWLYERAGGGKYLVALTHPDEAELGVLYKFSINVPGNARMPSNLASQEQAHAASSTSASDELAKRLIASGLPPSQAYTTASQMIKDNPQLGASLQASAPSEEDDMAGMMQMMMSMQMMQQQAAERAESRREEREWKQKQLDASKGPDPAVKALQEQNAAILKQLEAEKDARQKAESQRERDAVQRQLDEMKRLFEEKSKQPATDPVANSLSAMGQMFATMQQNQTQAQLSSRESESKLMQAMLTQMNSEKGMLSELSKSQIDQMRVQAEIQKAKMEEPVQQAKVMAELVGMFGGLAQAMVQMQAQMQGNPALDAIRELGSAVPGLIEGLIGVDTTRGDTSAAADTVVSSDEGALEAELARIQAAQSTKPAVAPAAEPPAAPAATRQKELPETQEAPQAPQAPAAETPQGPPESTPTQLETEIHKAVQVDPTQAREIGAQVLELLNIQGADAILGDPEALEVFLLMLEEDAAPQQLGRRLVDLLVRVEGDVAISVKDHGKALVEKLGWSPVRATAFFRAFMERYEEVAKAA